MLPKEHFHSLDALRFFAFLKVFLLHLPINAFAWFSFVKAGGGLGVEFFFVLSGFLISYLCIKEKEAKTSFSLKNFFMRRVLRIWPLYYLMVAFAFATPYILNYLNLGYSNEGYEPSAFHSLLFLENYKMMQEGMMPNVSPLGVMWSLCIEEHFYIIWGIVFILIPAKKFGLFTLIGLAISFISKIYFTSMGWDHGEILTHLDLFCYGGLLAYLYFYKNALYEKYIGSWPIILKRIGVGLILLFVLINPFILNEGIGQLFHTTLYGILFFVLIALFLSKELIFKIGDKSPLNYLGKISYGLYVYHIIVINLLIQLFRGWEYNLDSPLMAFSFLVLALILSVAISGLSYRLFEKPFLKLKKYFRD